MRNMERDNKNDKTGHSQDHFSIVPNEQVNFFWKFPQFRGKGDHPVFLIFE